MRSIRRATLTASVIALVGLLCLSTTAATAEPGSDPSATPTITRVPERPAPEDLTPFSDNPAITDSHLQSIESWSRLPDGDAVSVHFTIGTPECFGVHAEVQETADIIAVKLYSGTLPEAIGRACTMIAVFGAATVLLESPVGNRAVVSIT